MKISAWCTRAGSNSAQPGVKTNNATFAATPSNNGTVLLQGGNLHLDLNNFQDVLGEIESGAEYEISITKKTS